PAEDPKGFGPFLVRNDREGFGFVFGTHVYSRGFELGNDAVESRFSVATDAEADHAAEWREAVRAPIPEFLLHRRERVGEIRAEEVRRFRLDQEGRAAGMRHAAPFLESTEGVLGRAKGHVEEWRVGVE